MAATEKKLLLVLGLGFGLGGFRFGGLGLAFGRCFGGLAAVFPRRGFPGVIGYVPAGALELHGGGGEELRDLAPAFGALARWRLRQLL